MSCISYIDRGEFVVPLLIIAVVVLFIILCALALTVLITWAYCRIFSKAGYNWALGLLMLVPLANIIIPLYLAFGDWPVLKELRSFKEKLSK